MTQQRIRDLRALAADPAAAPAEARAANAAADRIAQRLQALEEAQQPRRQPRPLRSSSLRGTPRSEVSGPWEDIDDMLDDAAGAAESLAEVLERHRARHRQPPRRGVDVSTSRPPEVPTVSVHREYGSKTTQPAPYWCPTCGQGRNYSGPCPKCHNRVTEV